MNSSQDAPQTDSSAISPATKESKCPAALDYPAAHSMDTAWFAVDKEGNIGLFDTSEDGALPEAACSGGMGGGGPRAEFDAVHMACFAEEYWEGFKELEQDADFNAEWLAPCASVTDAEEKCQRQDAGAWSLKPCWVALSVQDGDKLETRDRARFDPFGPWLISKRPLSTRTIRRLSDHGVRLVDPSKICRDIDEIGEASRVFRFGKEHGTDPGLYERQQSPSHPLKAQDVPGAKVSRLRLPVQFSEAPQIHLADFIKDGEASYAGDWALRWPDVPDTKP